MRLSQRRRVWRLQLYTTGCVCGGGGGGGVEGGGGEGGGRRVHPL